MEKEKALLGVYLLPNLPPPTSGLTVATVDTPPLLSRPDGGSLWQQAILFHPLVDAYNSTIRT